MRCLAIVATVLVLAACQGPSPDFASEHHDAAARFRNAAATSRAAPLRPNPPVRLPHLGEAEDALGRHDRSEELKGLIPSAAIERLGGTRWLEHPTVEAARGALRVARARFGQARQLEELLLAYRRYTTPGRDEAPIVAPARETLRGRINDAELAAAWHGLRQAILDHHARIVRECSQQKRLSAEERIGAEQLSILDDLITVTDARIRTGGARQADLLTLRGERARRAAGLEGTRAHRRASEQRLREFLRSDPPAAAELLALPPPPADPSALATRIEGTNPGLLAQRAELRRRIATLRLADLGASMGPPLPALGVRAATRAEARERVARQRAIVANHRARLERALSTALAEREAAARTAEALRTRTIPDAQRAVRDTRAAFGGRARGFEAVFRATRQLFEAQIEHARAEDRLLRAHLDLQLLIGSFLP